MGIPSMEAFMILVKYFTRTYENKSYRTRVKAELTAVMLLFILLSMILELIASIFISRQNVLVTTMVTVAFFFVLLLLKSGRIILTGNLFVIAGFYKLIEFFPLSYSHQFYLQCFLGSLVAVAIYIKPYQLITTFSYTLFICIYRLIHFNQTSVSLAYKTEMAQATLTVISFLVIGLFYDRVIKNEITISKKTKKLSQIDELTQLHNRQHFDYVLTQKVENHDLVQIAILDIDYFKKINDSFGHIKGDQVLIKFGELLKDHFKASSVFRWGGEEFVILYEGESFGNKLYNFKNIVESTDFLIGQRLTVSIGYLESDKLNYEELLRRADDALFKAKDNGRNRVESY